MSVSMRIAAVSVSADELQHIRKVFDAQRARLPHNWSWSSEAEADVLLIDVDSVYGHMDWLRAQASGRRVVSLSSHRGSEHDVTLLRPVTADGLVNALNTVVSGKPAAAPAAERAAPAARAPAPAATPRQAAAPAQAQTPAAPRPAPAPAPVAATPPPVAAPAPVAPVLADPPAVPAAAIAHEMPLADFCTVEALPLPARLVRGETPAITIDAASEVYFGPTALKPLAAYCQGLIARDEWEPVSAAVMDGLRASGTAQPLTRLLWLFAVVNSNGQLMAGLDPNAKYKLQRWPQIEREFPKHFRIGTVMMKGPATLTEISDQSGAPLSDVIDFVNAYIAIGVVEMEGVAAPAAANEAGGGGLLARLRARARRG